MNSKRATAAKTANFPGIKDGETFKVGDIEFIKFPDMNGVTPVVTRNIVFTSEFGKNSHLADSVILKRLEKEFLPKITDAVGADKLRTIRTDLTTLDGLKPYEDMESLVSLPTFDFYRANVGIFDKTPVSGWWWLATPESAKPHVGPSWIVIVAPSGSLYGDSCNYDNGVRPFLLFDSSIFAPCEG